MTPKPMQMASSSKLERVPRQFGKRWLEFNLFLQNIKKGKTFIWFHPDWIMMDWKSYRRLQDNGRKISGVVYDEVGKIPDELFNLLHKSDYPNKNQIKIRGGKMKTFTVYRTNARDIKDDIEKDNYNAGDMPQFEGVVFSDGRVVIRWLTPNRSSSFWDDMETLKAVHIYAHPDYGTKIVWSDGIEENL